MKVGEQALSSARLKGLQPQRAEARLHEWFDRLEISDWWNKKVEELSKAWRRKCSLSSPCSTIPTSSSSTSLSRASTPSTPSILKREILRLRDQGATVIFSTHNMAPSKELSATRYPHQQEPQHLSGNVRDIREAFGNNTYELGFVGSPRELTRTAFRRRTRRTEPRGHDSPLCRSPRRPTTRVLGAANQAVQVASFRRMLPSMDNIFVQAVEAPTLKRTAMNSPLGIIISREYLERVKKAQSFIISTILGRCS